MSAGTMMSTTGFDTRVSARITRRLVVQPTADTCQRLRGAVRRLEAATVVLIGFTAAMGWTFVGSLVLGLGTGSASKVTAWLWLAGESLICAAVFAAVLLGAPSGHSDT